MMRTFSLVYTFLIDSLYPLGHGMSNPTFGERPVDVFKSQTVLLQVSTSPFGHQSLGMQLERAPSYNCAMSLCHCAVMVCS